MDKNTCWYDTKTIIDEMNRNYPVYKDLMETTEHVQSLKVQIDFLCFIGPLRKLIVADLGCGTAQISLLFDKDKFEYEGCDLSHILQYCAQKWHPENIYLPFDAELSHYYFLKNYDLVLMNAFIDVMENPLHILENVLEHSKKYVILHRQEVSSESPTHSIKRDSYNGYTYHSIINENDFNSLILKHNFSIIKYKSCGFNNWENGGGSYLLQKNP